jgi:hypothetical protein
LLADRPPTRRLNGPIQPKRLGGITVGVSKATPRGDVVQAPAISQAEALVRRRGRGGSFLASRGVISRRGLEIQVPLATADRETPMASAALGLAHLQAAEFLAAVLWAPVVLA